jgi:hypothetical protein
MFVSIKGRPGKFKLLRRGQKNCRVQPKEGGDTFLVSILDLVVGIDPPAIKPVEIVKVWQTGEIVNYDHEGWNYDPETQKIFLVQNMMEVSNRYPTPEEKQMISLRA